MSLPIPMSRGPLPTRLALPSALLFLIAAAGRVPAADLPEYAPVPGVGGDLSSVGSDTLNNLMVYWGEAFGRHYPNVRFGVEGKGSGTAPPALAQGVSQLAPMSRPMTAAERESIEKARGAPPLEIAVAVDCVAVYVHKDNPIRGLTLPQADALFSATRLRGEPEASTWGALGLEGAWGARPVSLYGRNAASGTYAFFKEAVLLKGDYKDTVKEQPGSAAAVDGVAGDLGGVGYSGIGYRTSGVRALPLAEKAGAPFVEPTFENALDGSYPLGRSLLVYVARVPGQPLEPAVREFLAFVLSAEGQAIVVKDGYGALPAEVALEQLAALD